MRGDIPSKDIKKTIEEGVSAWEDEHTATPDSYYRTLSPDALRHEYQKELAFFESNINERAGYGDARHRLNLLRHLLWKQRTPPTEDELIYSTEHIPTPVLAGTVEKKDIREYPVLYRSVGTSELFFLFREGFVPLRKFEGSADTDAPAGSLLTFWFKQPVALTFSSAVLELHTELLPFRPKRVSEGTMRFRYKDHHYYDVDRYDLEEHEIDEVYIRKDRVPLAALTVRPRLLNARSIAELLELRGKEEADVDTFCQNIEKIMPRIVEYYERYGILLGDLGWFLEGIYFSEHSQKIDYWNIDREIILDYLQTLSDFFQWIVRQKECDEGKEYFSITHFSKKISSRVQ